jgi:Obg family GTPase CgtA-like protein
MALVNEEKARAEETPDEEIPVLRPAREERFSVHRDEQGRFVIEGYRPVSFVRMMDTEMPGAYDEILRRLERWGIAKVLRREGIETGDTMVFGDVELEWDG